MVCVSFSKLQADKKTRRGSQGVGLAVRPGLTLTVVVASIISMPTIFPKNKN
jgi:hypothetical protein